MFERTLGRMLKGLSQEIEMEGRTLQMSARESAMCFHDTVIIQVRHLKELWSGNINEHIWNICRSKLIRKIEFHEQ